MYELTADATTNQLIILDLKHIHAIVIFIIFFCECLFVIKVLALLTLPGHLSSPPVFCGVHIAQSLLVLCVVFCRSMFFIFLLAIVLSALPRVTASDYHYLVSSYFSLVLGARVAQ
jgi:hypothetical protein